MLKRATNHLKREVWRYLGIIFASLFFGVGYSWFLLPYNMAPGGVAGIAQIVNKFASVPYGITMIVINIPLFVLSFIFIGKSFGGKSLWGMLVASGMTDLISLQSLHKFNIIPDLGKYTHVLSDGREIVAMLPPEDIYLTAIAGSVLLGIGLGLIFKLRGSTGGTDIPVALIKQKAGLSIGMGYWLVETAIILSVGIAFADPKLVIWGYVNLFITSKITDITSEGLPFIKGVYIISNEVDSIRNEIMAKLDRGVTFLKAESGYHKRDIKVLFCVLNRRQVPQLTDIVKDHDPEAFMVVTDVNDVLGYGFKSRNVNLSN